MSRREEKHDSLFLFRLAFFFLFYLCHRLSLRSLTRRLSIKDNWSYSLCQRSMKMAFMGMIKKNKRRARDVDVHLCNSGNDEMGKF